MKMVELNEILDKIRYESIAQDSLLKIAKEAFSRMNYQSQMSFIASLKMTDYEE